jgi:5-methylcytosine-specific restriction endonuclease McrA
MQDLYDSDEWKNATPKQRQDFISKVQADRRIERDLLAAEEKKKKSDAKPTPTLSKKPSKAQRKAAAQLKKQIRYIDRPKIIKRRVKVSGIDVTSTDFLSTYEWRKVRMEALKKHGPVCQCCGATPATGAVMNVDHIKPRKLFPHLALDVSNLQVLCHECNHGKGNWDQTDWR